jgi:hypothetical protein
MANVTLNEMNKMLAHAVKRFKQLGYNVGNVLYLDVSSRYSRAWAKCTWKSPRYDKTFTITVSDRLFKANKVSVRDIIYHEVIHTIPGCFNHGPMFKRAAKNCNTKYGTNISVTASEAEVYYGKGSVQVKEYTEYILRLKQERKEARKAMRKRQAACK